VQHDLDTTLSPIVFKKERLADCDESEKKFLKWLLEIVEVREGVQIELKELIEMAKPHFGERAVRGFRELFQETAWQKGSRFILGIRPKP
jgi:hypothetical protein